MYQILKRYQVKPSMSIHVQTDMYEFHETVVSLFEEHNNESRHVLDISYHKHISRPKVGYVSYTHTGKEDEY